MLCIDLHFTNGINRVFARNAGQNYGIQVDGLRQVPKRDQALVRNLDIWDSRLDQDLRNLPSTQDFAAARLCGYSGCKIHG